MLEPLQHPPWLRLCWPPYFSAHNFLSVDILSNVIADYLLCMTHLTVLDNLFQMFACVYRTMISDKQTEHSLNFTTFYVWSLQHKLCVIWIWEHAKSSLAWVDFASSMTFKFTVFHYDCIVANFAIGFSWISRIGTEPTFTFWPLLWYCCNLSGGVALIVWFTTNRMCVKNNTIIYVARADNSKRDYEHDHYCCLLPRCEVLRTCHSGFPIATICSNFW